MWHGQLPPWWKDQLIVTKLRISHGSDTDSRPRYALARTARAEKPEALAGIHAENMLLIVDEASGVPEAVYETAEGTLSTDGARVILTSNPTRTEGYFWNTHHRRSEEDSWVRLHFNAEMSPLADEKWLREMKEKYGTDSDVYRVRVKGDFPAASADVLIPMYLVTECYGRDIVPEGQRIAGLDVARFGDDANAFAIRQGSVATKLETWRNKDLMWTVGRVYQSYRDHEFDCVAVDVIGLGSGVADRLKEMNVPVIMVNVSESSSSRDKYSRLRDELWWNSKVFFSEKRGGVDVKKIKRETWEDLAAELSSPRFDYDSGRLRIESKRAMKSRGLMSPNLADAWNMTFAHSVAGLIPQTSKGIFGRNNRIQQAPSVSGAFLG